MQPEGATAQPGFLYGLIIACEAAFWVLLVLALSARYVWQRQRLGQTLLLCLPAIDLVLLAITAADLRAGAPATFAHGLATAYVGFTLAFGSVAMGWADRRFAHRFAAGPPPERTPARGWPAIRREFDLWFRSIAAWLVTLALLIGLIAFVDDEAVTQTLQAWFPIAFASVFFWFIFGPAWSLLFHRREAG